ncbi:hypothetical protein [Ciceribacter ferrooxidans]|uniref:Uncharacterized protein n=1 Tax=Ciceribacter ferrooxidans TaxID=2509717 RepID=A0A4Q2TIZ7_9HYPH|nr:hypothetical protein [Ciceribacter ferrooxidans]RYC17336.1 hypothetical protein EUU22_04910 [Ciceribacter ferrooxidans]
MSTTSSGALDLRFRRRLYADEIAPLAGRAGFPPEHPSRHLRRDGRVENDRLHPANLEIRKRHSNGTKRQRRPCPMRRGAAETREQRKDGGNNKQEHRRCDRQGLRQGKPDNGSCTQRDGHEEEDMSKRRLAANRRVCRPRYHRGRTGNARNKTFPARRLADDECSSRVRLRDNHRVKGDGDGECRPFPCPGPGAVFRDLFQDGPSPDRRTGRQRYGIRLTGRL